MKIQSFSVSVVSAAPPERIFELLADGAHWADWAGPLVPASRWVKQGSPAPGGVGAVRALGRRPLIDLEEVLVNDPPRRHAYTITSGIPVQDYLGTVDLVPAPDGSTRINWHAQFSPRYPGTGLLLRALSKLVVSSIARHLATEASRTSG